MADHEHGITDPITNWLRTALAPALNSTWRGLRDWARFNHDGTAPPRALRYALAVAAVLLVSIVFGVITARASANFGPHDATYEVTIDSAITADAGPLGSVVLDSPLPLSLGVHVRIGEIPDSLTTVEGGSTLQALNQDLDSYLQFFAAPQETIEVVTGLLVENAVKRAFALAVGIGVALAVMAYVAGFSRRRELAYRAARATWGLTAGFVVLSLVGAAVFTQAAQREAQAIGGRETAVLAGTGLEGTRITGRLSGVIDEYGGQLLDVYNDNQEFYAQANVQLASAYDRRAAIEDATDRGLGRYGEDAPEDLVTMLLISDLHCNVGMAPLIRTVAEKSGAQIILNGGDTTMNGTDVERFCMQTFASAVPQGAVMVQSDGNHDSEITGAQARAAGVIVLDGSIVEVEGIRFLGDSDPRATRIGQGSVLVGEETYHDAGTRLAETSCESDDGADILLIHTPAVGAVTLENGCVPYQLSGHMHRQIGPAQVGKGIQYVSASTAGAVHGKATIGPLNGVAEMTVLRFDRDSRTIVDYQVITVDTNGSANAGPRLRYPELPINPDDLEGMHLGGESGEEANPEDLEDGDSSGVEDTDAEQPETDSQSSPTDG
jgi:hypothetical protein